MNPEKFQKIPFTNKNFSLLIDLIDQFSVLDKMSDIENGLRSSPFWRVSEINEITIPRRIHAKHKTIF